jgi:sugar (pentulose or hexulose) kinase
VTEPLAIGIDVGTSGVRAVAIDGSGAAVAKGEAPNAGGAARSDPASWWSGVEAALDQLLQQVDRTAVAALAVDGTSGTMLAIDAAGRPLGPALMYDDMTAASHVARVAAEAPAESAAHGPTSGLAKALQLQALDGVRAIVHQADWVASRLTGLAPRSDENNALKTGYDPVARRWPAWIAATGLRDGLLPAVLVPGTPIAPLSAAIAERFGLPRRAMVCAGTTDGCAAFLATGAAQPGEAVTALGTTLVVKLMSERPIFAPRFGIYSHRIGDRWLAGGASNTGGGALARFFGPDAIAALSQRIDPARDSGLDYYPLARPGERFPVNDPDLAPRVAPRPADDALFLHGLLEGIARIERLSYERLAELGAGWPTALYTVGGGAANATWSALRSRIVGIPPAAARSEASAVGAARLALAR